MKMKLNRQQQNKKLSALKISLKLIKKNGNSYTYHTGKVRRIYSIVSHENFSQAFLKVDYGKGLNNSGFYPTKEELLFALKAFTERSLVEELQNG